MKVRGFPDRMFGANTYIVSDDRDEAALVVDPTLPYREIVSFLGFTPRFEGILLTHAHADHMICLDDWRRETGAPVSVGASDEYAMRSPEANCAGYLGMPQVSFGYADRMLADHDRIIVGGESLTVLSSPGHTVGSVCYLGRDFILTGDTMFADGGVGRTDFFGGSEDALRASLSMLCRLPGNPKVYPGHGDSSYLTREALFHSY